jgi:hypothetical protein
MGLKIFTNVKYIYIYEKRIFLHHFFLKEKKIRFEKIENHVAIFRYWF